MQYDYFKENPYKKNEASFNSEKYKGSNSNDKQVLFKLLETFGLL